MSSARSALLVLGPHRSGTSATARVINLLGVELGRDMLPPKFDNRHGYWEHRAIFELHELLLSKTGSAWHDYRPMAAGWQEWEEVGPIRRDLVALLTEEFGDTPLWGVKDPRLGRLVPLWLGVLDELAVEPHFVVVVRNPLEVVGSLERRNGFSHGKSIALCLAEMIAAVRETEGRRRTFVSYARLLEDWPSVVDAMAGELDLRWPRPLAEAAAEIDAFLRPAERHHRRTVDDLHRDPAMPQWGIALFEALEKAAGGDAGDLGPAVEDAFRGLGSAIGLFVPDIETLQARAAHAEAELTEVRARLDALLGSRMYRVTAPLWRLWAGLVGRRD